MVGGQLNKMVVVGCHATIRIHTADAQSIKQVTDRFVTASKLQSLFFATTSLRHVIGCVEYVKHILHRSPSVVPSGARESRRQRLEIDDDKVYFYASGCELCSQI